MVCHVRSVEIVRVSSTLLCLECERGYEVDYVCLPSGELAVRCLNSRELRVNKARILLLKSCSPSLRCKWRWIRLSWVVFELGPETKFPVSSFSSVLLRSLLHYPQLYYERLTSFVSTEFGSNSTGSFWCFQ